MEKASITFFNRPSTRLSFRFEDNGYVHGVIRHTHCQEPISLKRKLQSADLSHYVDPEMKVCIELSWQDCEADLKVYHKCKVKK